MKQIFHSLVFALAGIMAAGCASVTLVDSTKPAQVGKGVSVMPQIAWNQIKQSGQTIWTEDGFGLDAIYFITDVQNDKPLYAVPGVRGDALTTFKTSMLPNDIEDLVVSTMVKEGYDNVRADALAPCPFGSETGFCFDLVFATKDGLEMKGKVVADKRVDTLDVFEFRAASEHYFEALSPTVAKVFASVQAQ